MRISFQFEGPVLTETGLVPELDGSSHLLHFDVSINSEISIEKTECNSNSGDFTVFIIY